VAGESDGKARVDHVCLPPQQASQARHAHITARMAISLM